MTASNAGHGLRALRHGLAERSYQAYSRAPRWLVTTAFTTILSLYLVLPNILNPAPLGVRVPNAATFGAFFFMLTLPYLGKAALRRAPLDGLMFFWVILACASHLYSATVLQRYMFEWYLLTYLYFLGTMWILYRVGFTMVALRPRHAVRVFQRVVFGLCMLGAVVGILQNNGPVQGVVTDLVLRITPTADRVLEGVSTISRPTAWYGGPNILGYFNAVGVALIVGYGMVRAETITRLQTAAIAVGLGIFIYSTINSQTRTTLVMIGVLCLGLFVVMVRARQFGKVLSVVGAVGVLVLFTTALGVQKFTYLFSTFSDGLTKDASFVIREHYYTQWVRLANEASILGLGQSQVNNPNLVGISGFDYYYIPGIDNEWANIYQAHGVIGPLLVVTLLIISVRLAMAQVRSKNLVRRTIGAQALAIVLILALGTPGAVRMVKFETAGIFFVLLGILTGLRWVTIREELEQDDAHRRTEGTAPESTARPLPV